MSLARRRSGPASSRPGPAPQRPPLSANLTRPRASSFLLCFFHQLAQFYLLRTFTSRKDTDLPAVGARPPSTPAPHQQHPSGPTAPAATGASSSARAAATANCSTEANATRPQLSTSAAHCSGRLAYTTTTSLPLEGCLSSSLAIAAPVAHFRPPAAPARRG